MSKNSLASMIVVAMVAALVGGGAGYYLGKTPQLNQPNTRQMMGSNFSGNQNRNGTRLGFGGGAIGQITSVDDKSITLKLQDGSSKIVLISDKTVYENTTKAGKDDAKTGVSVRIMGTTNNDGSITAANVSLNSR